MSKKGARPGVPVPRNERGQPLKGHTPNPNGNLSLEERLNAPTLDAALMLSLKQGKLTITERTDLGDKITLRIGEIAIDAKTPPAVAIQAANTILPYLQAKLPTTIIAQSGGLSALTDDQIADLLGDGSIEIDIDQNNAG